jgi:hypothetical protein
LDPNISGCQRTKSARIRPDLYERTLPLIRAFWSRDDFTLRQELLEPKDDKRPDYIRFDVVDLIYEPDPATG